MRISVLCDDDDDDDELVPIIMALASKPGLVMS
jgi:hypothetical protein